LNFGLFLCLLHIIQKRKKEKDRTALEKGRAQNQGKACCLKGEKRAEKN